MKNICMLFSLLFTIFISTSIRAQKAIPNLVTNGDFSQIVDGKPVSWISAGNEATVKQAITLGENNGHPYLRLTCTHIEGSGGDTHAMLAQVGLVHLEQGKTYRLSCQVKSEGIAGQTVHAAIVDTSDWEGCGLETDIPLTSQWKPWSIIFKAARTVWQKSRMQFWFTETGSFYIRSVRLMEITPVETVFTNTAPHTQSRNLIYNGSFDAGTSGWTSSGISTGWGNLAHLHGEIIASSDHEHSHFLRIPLGGANTPVLYFDYLIPSVTPQTKVLAANLGWIPVKPGETYTLSCNMRSTLDGVNAQMGVFASDPDKTPGWQIDQHTNMPLTTSWNRYQFHFQAPTRYLYVAVGPNLNNGQSTNVDIDNIQLEKGDTASTYAAGCDIEAGMTPSEPGGVFTIGEKAFLILRAGSHLAASTKLTIYFTATDFFGRSVQIPASTITIPADASISKIISLPSNWRGFYEVIAHWNEAGTPYSQIMRLAFVPRRTSDDSIMGINHAFPDRFLIQLARKAGVAWYRDWSLKWQDIEPVPGEWKWKIADQQIDRVLKENVHLMALLPPFPSANWSSEAPEESGSSGYPGSRLRQAWAPKNPALMASFISRAVDRYKSSIRYWEFLNEPIFTDYSLPGQGVGSYPGRRYTPADYVNLLKIAAAAMRSSNPSCRVIGGIASGPEHMTQELINAGILNIIDMFNLHIYPGLRTPEGYETEMDHLLAMMGQRGGQKPIWITEFAYYGCDNLPRKPFTPNQNSWAEGRLLPDERTCADYTIRFLCVMLARGVQKVFIHSGTSAPVNEPDMECPIFAENGAARKLFPALAVFTNMAGPHPKPILHKTLGKDCHIVAFETGSRSVIALWNADGNAQNISIGAKGINCFDIMGNHISPKSLSCTSDPIYIMGASGQAGSIAKSIQCK
jgi:hypothetical protein